MQSMSDWNSQLRRGVLEFSILALIERGPRYGYEIVTELAAVPQLASGEGTVYPLLRRLRKEAWLDTFWQPSDAGPPRQYYQLTPTGAQALAAMRREWADLVAAIQHFTDGGTQSE